MRPKITFLIMLALSNAFVVAEPQDREVPIESQPSPPNDSGVSLEENSSWVRGSRGGSRGGGRSGGRSGGAGRVSGRGSFRGGRSEGHRAAGRQHRGPSRAPDRRQDHRQDRRQDRRGGFDRRNLGGRFNQGGRLGRWSGGRWGGRWSGGRGSRWSGGRWGRWSGGRWGRWSGGRWGGRWSGGWYNWPAWRTGRAWPYYYYGVYDYQNYYPEITNVYQYVEPPIDAQPELVPESQYSESENPDYSGEQAPAYADEAPIDEVPRSRSEPNKEGAPASPIYIDTVNIKVFPEGARRAEQGINSAR